MKLNVILSSAMIAASFSASPVLAADALTECTCVTAPGSYSNGVGALRDPSGSVSITTAEGYGDVTSDVALPNNSTTSVGANGTVKAVVGKGCTKLVLDALTTMRVSTPADLGGDIRVQITDKNGAILPLGALPGLAAAGAAGSTATLVGVGVGVAAIAGGIALIASDDKKAKSP